MSFLSTSFLLVVLVLVFEAQHAACRAVPGSASAPDVARRSLLNQQAAAVQASRHDAGAKIDGQFIVLFKQSAGAAAVASQKLAASVQRGAATAAAAASATGTTPLGFEVVSTLSLNTGSSGTAAGGAAAAAAGAASAASAVPPAAAGGVQGIVVRASPATIAQIRAAHDIVQTVVPDRVVVSQQLLQDEQPQSGPAAAAGAVEVAAGAGAGAADITAQQVPSCTQAAAAAAGVSARLAATFKWPRCLVPGAKIVWSGRSCGDGSKIQYTQMRAVDAATGKTLRIQGTPCITRFDPQRVTWSRQRFGKCGSAPLQVPALPTRICSATGGNPGSFISGPTPANPNPASPQQPPAASPAPDGDQQDPNGSSTAAPDLQEAASPSPLPDAADASPSPAPFTRSGLLLPRVPLSAGDSAPSGVQRIEAATPDGVDNTEGLPVEQQVTVGVIDSGVDRTHPDINYAGGQSFTAADANADQDAYGHGTHVAGIIGAKNNGQGVVGVSPGAPVYSLKVLDGQGRGSMSGVIAAVSWVATEGVKQGIRVINLSLATMVDPKSEEYAATVDAVCGVFAQAEAAGVFVAVAAGNYGDALRGYLPAACPSVAAVTAVDETGSAAASFSNFLEVNGATPEDQARIIAAPGTKIRSTISFAKDSTGYRELSGTSMASPHIAGIAASCMMSGACPQGSSGLATLATLQGAARERLAANAQYGFAGDATSTINGKFFGLLAWAKW